MHACMHACGYSYILNIYTTDCWPSIQSLNSSRMPSSNNPKQWKPNKGHNFSEEKNHLSHCKKSEHFSKDSDYPHVCLHLYVRALSLYLRTPLLLLQRSSLTSTCTLLLIRFSFISLPLLN